MHFIQIVRPWLVLRLVVILGGLLKDLNLVVILGGSFKDLNIVVILGGLWKEGLTALLNVVCLPA